MAEGAESNNICGEVKTLCGDNTAHKWGSFIKLHFKW